MCSHFPWLSAGFEVIYSWKQLVLINSFAPQSYQRISLQRVRQPARAPLGSILGPFLIGGHGGLFFPGWLCLSTWPHKDRQRWLSYINTCRGIAPLTLHEISHLPNAITECTALLEINCFPIKYSRSGVNLLHALSPSAARYVYCQALLNGGICISFPQTLNSSPPREVKFSSAWQASGWKSWNLRAKFTRTDRISQRHHGSIWNHVAVASFSIPASDWFPLFILCTL